MQYLVNVHKTQYMSRKANNGHVLNALIIVRFTLSVGFDWGSWDNDREQ